MRSSLYGLWWKMNVLITFALENEFAPWRKFRHFRGLSVDAPDRTYGAKIGLADVRVVLTGAGRLAVERAIVQAFTPRPDICIASGLSGALRPHHRPGEILVARTVGEITGTRLMRGDAGLILGAEASGAKVVDRLVVSDRVIATAEEKCGLAASGDAVDMESIYVLAAATERQIRSVAVRAISDGAERDLPLDFSRVFNERGAVSIPRVIAQVVRQPGRIGGLIRLAQESGRAASLLARFLDSYVERVAAGPLPESRNLAVMAL
jgi:adenosylhomocysteine nucleosidase